MKNKSKIVLTAIITAVITTLLVGSLSIYAAYNYFATDVTYTKADGSETTVDLALDELYRNIQNNSGNNDGLIDVLDSNITKNILCSTRTKGNSVSITLDPGNYLVIVIYENGSSTNASLASYNDVTNEILEISDSDASYELLTGYSIVRYGSSKLGTSYVGIGAEHQIYKCELNKQTTLSISYNGDGYAGYAQIMTLYAIPIA